MASQYNDDLQIEDEVRSRRWDQFKDMDHVFSKKGKPSQYRINLISLGRVGYSFSKQLLEYMRGDPSFIELNIWHRITRKMKGGIAIDVSPDESKAILHKNLLDIMTDKGGDVKFKEYRTLEDLKRIVDRNKDNPGIGEITVITSRYNFNFTNLPDPIVENIIHTSIYDVSDGINKAKNRISEERKVLENIVEKVKKETNLKKDRADYLKDTVIGIRELANVFRDYRGNVLVAVNEVDTTSYIFAKQSRIDPRKVEGLSHNDQLRYEAFLRQELSAIFSDRSICVPIVGSHNEFLTAVWDLITIDDRLKIYNVIREGHIDHSELRKKVTNFGLLLFKTRGSSDEDTSKALLHQIKSIMYEDLRGDHVVRASTRFQHPKFPGDYFIGVPLRHDNELAIPDTTFVGFMNEREREIFEKGVEVQKYINQLLMDNEIIPKEWDYEEFKPAINSQIEKPVHLRNEINKNGLEKNVRDSGTKVPEVVTVSGIISGQNIKIETVNIYQGKEGVEEVRVGDKEREKVTREDMKREESETEKKTLHVKLPSDLETRLYSMTPFENIGAASTILVHDLTEAKFIKQIVFPNSSSSSWIESIKALEDKIMVLLGTCTPYKNYTYTLYSIDPNSFEIKEIHEIKDNLISDFDFCNGKAFFSVRDKIQEAVRVIDINSGEELISYKSRPAEYLGVRVFPLSLKLGIFGISEDEMSFWEEENWTHPHTLVDSPNISKKISVISLEGSDLIAYGYNDYSYIKKVTDKTENYRIRFKAKNSKISLDVTENVVSAYVINPDNSLRKYNFTLVDLDSNSQIDFQEGEVDYLGNEILKGLIIGINLTKDKLMVVGENGYISFKKDSLEFLNSFKLENAGRDCYDII